MQPLKVNALENRQRVSRGNARDVSGPGNRAERVPPPSVPPSLGSMSGYTQGNIDPIIISNFLK